MQPREGPVLQSGQPQYQTMATIPKAPDGDAGEAVDEGQPEPPYLQQAGAANPDVHRQQAESTYV